MSQHYYSNGITVTSSMSLRDSQMMPFESAADVAAVPIVIEAVAAQLFAAVSNCEFRRIKQLLKEHSSLDLIDFSNPQNESCRQAGGSLEDC